MKSRFLIGDTIGPFLAAPTPMDAFMFSAVTFNRHQIHYNKDRALAEGLPDIVVQRGLIGNYFARMLGIWLEGAGRISGINWKVIKSAPVNRQLLFRGTLISIEDSTDKTILRCSLEGLLDGELFASGEAVLSVDP